MAAAKIIAVYNQKGGCGKTMTSMQMGGACALLGKKVLIVDMDKQGTSIIWSSRAQADAPFPATVISLAPLKEKMIQEIRKYVDDYDLIIIDCPPAIDSTIPWAALQVADIGIIPIIPVMDNIWASREAKELATRAREDNQDLRTYYLASNVRRGNLFKLCVDTLAKDQDVTLLKSMLSMRNAFPESQLLGLTVHALDKKSAASEEVDALSKEVLAILGMK